jgi:parvulin-like peptidyl-prolyl isomerase
VLRPGPERDAAEVNTLMLNLRQQLVDGADFSSLAKQYSDCGDDGDLGYFPRGQMVEAFDEVVFNMEKGGVSDVFVTQFGFHVVKVFDKIPEHLPSFEEMRGDIEKILLDEKKNSKIGEVVDRLREKADITEKEEPS